MSKARLLKIAAYAWLVLMIVAMLGAVACIMQASLTDNWALLIPAVALSFGCGLCYPASTRLYQKAHRLERQTW